MPAAAPSSPLQSRLIERIHAAGPITFAAYMEACLYDPEFGYYSGALDRRRSDYYTSVEISPVFGRLLARQLEEMWRIAGRPAPFTIVEGGAAAGRLAKHILDFAEENLYEFYEAMHYIAVEISPSRRELLQAALARHIAAGRASTDDQLPSDVPCGCIFSNELLDALPVHRVVMQAEGLREIFVDSDGERLIERELPPSSPDIAEFFEQQIIALRAGQQAEAGLAACRWIEDAGRRLGRGLVLTVDYGHEARELYDERHMNGTLLAYSRHRASEDFYRAPGEQDLTAHVNFTALCLCGQRVGLKLAGLTSQTNFLLGLARANNFADLRSNEWSEIERTRARLSFQNLVNPEGMGETFRVMIQHKGIAAPRLTGLRRP
jgi:SAM-dependent MidA family methyltransferase